MKRKHLRSQLWDLIWDMLSDHLKGKIATQLHGDIFIQTESQVLGRLVKHSSDALQKQRYLK